MYWIGWIIGVQVGIVYCMQGITVADYSVYWIHGVIAAEYSSFGIHGGTGI